MRDGLLKECSHIEEYSTYNAETHHQIAFWRLVIGKSLQLSPPIMTAILGALTATGKLPLYGAWLTALSAIFSALSTGLDPLASANNHLRAAKDWTCLKHDARRMRDVFSPALNDDALAPSVKALSDRYNDLVKRSPPTTDKAFEKARTKIQRDIHKPDNPELKPRA